VQRATTQGARAKWQERHNNSKPWQAAPRSANISPNNTTRRRAFVCCELKRKTTMTAIKWGLVAFVLFGLGYAVETRAILGLESSDKSGSQVYEYAP
jgi:hypothetical protein